MKRYTVAEWEKEQYKSSWNDCPYFRDMTARGEIPANYFGRRTVLGNDPVYGTKLLTEGYHFVIGDEEGRRLQ